MIRSIAIHLPQFHPIPENDAWWGKGFTEWTNVTKAKPLFNGHYQPHLPADLSFYDLRLPEARQAQADLAKEYGIEGFCYYHYWFNGRRILERPVQEMLASGKPNFPFMLCWANENWTRVWDGGEKHILLEQVYTPEDDLRHIQTLMPYFKDSRYIRINNKPVFAIYRSTLIPDMRQTINIWREEAARHHLELYICRFESLGIAGKNYIDAGFDAAIEFQPNIKHADRKTLLPIDIPSFHQKQPDLKQFINQVAGKKSRQPLQGLAFSYKDYIENSLLHDKSPDNYKLYRCVCPGWDNSPRRTSGYVLLHGSEPSLFKYWTEEVLKSFMPYSAEENLFFINAWNEWAEGNHLEPCQKWGTAYLQAFRDALTHIRARSQPYPDVRSVPIVNEW